MENQIVEEGGGKDAAESSYGEMGGNDGDAPGKFRGWRIAKRSSQMHIS